jgi:hypothetical protein
MLEGAVRAPRQHPSVRQQPRAGYRRFVANKHAPLARGLVQAPRQRATVRDYVLRSDGVDPDGAFAPTWSISVSLDRATTIGKKLQVGRTYVLFLDVVVDFDARTGEKTSARYLISKAVPQGGFEVGSDDRLIPLESAPELQVYRGRH